MPPLLKKYTASLKLDFPYVNFSMSTGFEEKKKDAVDENDKWKKSPLNQTLTINLFNNKLNLSENYTYNLENSNHESLKLSAAGYGFQLSYTMSYVQGYDFNDGWIIRKNKEWIYINRDTSSSNNNRNNSNNSSTNSIKLYRTSKRYCIHII